MREKCKKAVTDTISTVTFDPTERPGVANLISIHSSLTGKMKISVLPFSFSLLIPMLSLNYTVWHTTMSSIDFEIANFLCHG